MPLLRLSPAKGSREWGQKCLSQVLHPSFLSCVVNTAVNHLSGLSLDFSKKSLSIRAVGLSCRKSSKAEPSTLQVWVPLATARLPSSQAVLTERRMKEPQLGRRPGPHHPAPTTVHHVRLFSASGRQDSEAGKARSQESTDGETGPQRAKVRDHALSFPGAFTP